MSNIDSYNIFGQKTFRLFAILGLIGIAISLSLGQFLISGFIIAIPLFIIALFYILQYPNALLYIIFATNYFIMGISRYVNITGISVLMDTLLLSNLFVIIIHTVLTKNIEWKYTLNIITLSTAIWMIYCLLEVANPSSMFTTWALSRGLTFNGLLIATIAILSINKYSQLKALLFMYALFTFFAVLKALLQKYIGFDTAEMRWLMESESYKTHLIASGTRYFSFFTDAGNFGSNMGCAGIAFSIISFFMKNKALKIFYFIIGLLAIYAMFLSGTRGAMIVPLAGLALFIIISKNFKVILTGGILLAFIYCFFAFTYIGEGNALIRRMRTSFRPSNDASFNVRRENQKKLAQYLKNKPFGEGLGLSGVENRKYSIRLTTTTPHDSWYVKLWVETGIVGLIIYVSGLIAILMKCTQIIIFKIKNQELKGILSGLLCGIFGMMLSAYGNAFWGQYPTMITAFIFLALIIKGEYFDRQIENCKQEKEPQTIL